MRFTSRGVFVLVAVFLMSAIAVSAASAATLPEFKPVPSNRKLTSTSGKLTFTYGSEKITCAKSTAAGEVTTAKTVGKLVLKLTGCETAGAGGRGCPLRSENTSTAGEIVTSSLDGELGTVASSEAASGVGLLLKPESGKTWAELAENGCTPETNWTGTLAAEVATIGKKQATNKLVISDPSGVQKIRAITVDSGKAEKPQFLMWTVAVALEATDELAFAEALEVT